MQRREFLKAAAWSPLFPLVARARTGDLPWSAAGDPHRDQATVVAGGLGRGRANLTWWVEGEERAAGTRVEAASHPAAGNDGTCKFHLEKLPPGRRIVYRVACGTRQRTGRFRTRPGSKGEPLRLVWGGDVVGQGWGIDPKHGGMLTFRSMLETDPHLFLHCGDTIYADGPLKEQIDLGGGERWVNLLTPEKRRVARRLADFHGNHRYNLLDDHYRRFLSEVATVAQWDDHEVVNNWDPHTHGNLMPPARQAFLDYWPIRPQESRLYRRLSYGPDLEVFVLDVRSFRGPNSGNRQEKEGPETAMLGPDQLGWLQRALVESPATWKVIAAGMPLSTFSPRFGLDNWSNGPGAPLGREMELARLLSHLRKHRVRNLVWLCADVHYAAAVKFEPGRATFQDFDPFWEFIAGPLHAGTFSPTEPLDPTFGPRLEFCAVPQDLPPNRPPCDGLQFFGKLELTGPHLRVSLHRRDGKKLYATTLRADAQAYP